MGRVYFDDFGNPHGLPVGIESARRYKTRTFIDEECPVCGKKVYYTKNQRCILCARDSATDLYGLAIGTMRFDAFPEEFSEPGEEYITLHKQRHSALGNIGCRNVSTEYKEEVESVLAMVGEPASLTLKDAQDKGRSLWITYDPCGISGHYGVRTLRNECYFCEEERNHKRPRQAAIAAGKTWYVPDVPCKHCGQIAEKNVHNGQCKGCKSAAPVSVSPRQEAIRAGKTWYIPTTPCKYCRTLSERNVHNGSCKGCRPSKDSTPDEVMMKASPDLIIERDAAKALGMGVYRTGVPCENNHQAFRDVKTNNCLDCIKENTR